MTTQELTNAFMERFGVENPVPSPRTECIRLQNETLDPRCNADVLEPILRAARTEGFFFSALRKQGVFDS